jgi:Flp pilus assembly protein TadB
MESMVTMNISSRREAANRWSARHPILVGLAAGMLVTLIFVILLGYHAFSDVLISFGSISALVTLTALGERRRRKRLNLPL